MSNLAIYARVSSEIQEKEATIESQVAQLHEVTEYLYEVGPVSRRHPGESRGPVGFLRCWCWRWIRD